MARRADSGRACRPAETKGGTEVPPFLFTGLRLQLERTGVDAVALTGRTRPVREHVAEVAAARGAGDLGAGHPVGRVDVGVDALEIHRLDEARPAGARVELGVGPEQLRATAGTTVGAGRLRVG